MDAHKQAMKDAESAVIIWRKLSERGLANAEAKYLKALIRYYQVSNREK